MVHYVFPLSHSPRYRLIMHSIENEVEDELREPLPKPQGLPVQKRSRLPLCELWQTPPQRVDEQPQIAGVADDSIDTARDQRVPGLDGY